MTALALVKTTCDSLLLGRYSNCFSYLASFITSEAMLLTPHYFRRTLNSSSVTSWCWSARDLWPCRLWDYGPRPEGRLKSPMQMP